MPVRRADLIDQLNHERNRANQVERAAAEATTYVTRSESGRVLYQGDHESSAIAAARQGLRQGEHSSIDGSNWNTRQHGGARRIKRHSQ